MINQIEKFAFSRRARLAVKQSLKKNHPPIPSVTRHEGVKKSWIRRLFHLTEVLETFELQPVCWMVDEVNVKRGRVYLNIHLNEYMVRLSDGSSECDDWYSYQYRGLPGQKFPARQIIGFETGVTVLPFNNQQSRFLLKKAAPADGIWGVEADLEELKQAPDRLFCPHVTRQ